MKEPKAGSEAEKNWMIWVNIFLKGVVSTTNYRDNFGHVKHMGLGLDQYGTLVWWHF